MPETRLRDDVPRDPPRALLVEDDPAQRADVWGMLRALGYEVSAVESAEEAVRAIGQSAFGVILTDNILPGMTAFQALPRLRTAGVPVIVMSSQCGPDTETDARLLGAAAFLRKPFAAAELSRVLRRACAHGR